MAERSGQQNKAGLKYRFARDGEGTILDVTKVDRRPKGLTCLGCGRAMVVHLGDVRAHHFAHRRDGGCDGETYRHVLAKNVFCLRYKQAVREGQPFLVELIRPVVCAGRTDYPDCPEDFGSRLDVRDLTRHFDRAEMERKVGPYIADVLLSRSEEPPRHLFIEMLVKHESDEDKCAAVRMIEIAVPDESRMDDFDACRIRAGTFVSHNIPLEVVSKGAGCACAERHRREREAERERAELERSEAAYREEQRLLREELRRIQGEDLAAVEAQEGRQAEQREESRRRSRRQGKLDRVHYDSWLQSQTDGALPVRNTGERQEAGGPCVIVARDRVLPRKPPTLAYILNSLDFNDRSQIFNDYERGIIIRRRPQQWKPYVVEVVGSQNYEFWQLDEAITFYHSVAA